MAPAVALSVTACTGGDGAAPSPTSFTGEGPVTASVTRLDPPAFGDAVAYEGTYTVNVHVPDEGSIPDTDAAIPYDRIRARAAELPQDRSTPLAVYCRSGRMSAEAVTTLQELGYTDLVELRGGMDAWVTGGRDLLPPAG